MDETILAALAAITKVEEARQALETAQSAATEAVPVLVENGLATEDGSLTTAGTLAVQLVGQLLASRTTGRTAPKAQNGNGAIRNKLTDDELHTWIRTQLEADPSAGWAKLQGAFHAEGFASGWPRFKEAYREVRADFEADQAAAEAEAKAEAEAPKGRQRRAAS